METGKNLFAKRLQQLGLKKQVDAALVVEETQKRINEIFGVKAEGSVRAISFNKGVLKIATKSSAWANECQLHLLDIKKPPIERVVFEILIESD